MSHAHKYDEVEIIVEDKTTINLICGCGYKKNIPICCVRTVIDMRKANNGEYDHGFLEGSCQGYQKGLERAKEIVEYEHKESPDPQERAMAFGIAEVIEKEIKEGMGE